MTWDDPLLRVFTWCSGFALVLGVPALMVLRLPHRARGDLAAPLPGEPDPVWERFQRTSRTLDQLMNALPLGLVLLTPVLGARSVRETPWALVIIVVAVAIPALWIAPGLRRERGFVRQLLRARGAPERELLEAGYVEIWESEPVEEGREPWDALGYISLSDDGATLHTPGERISIPSSSVVDVASRAGGVHPLGIEWTTPSGGRRTISFVSRDGEMRFATARAQRELAGRLAAWHDGHARPDAS